MEFSQYHECAATFLSRVFFGCFSFKVLMLFSMLNFDAVFNVKTINVIEMYENSFLLKGIPGFLTVGGTWCTSFC